MQRSGENRLKARKRPPREGATGDRRAAASAQALGKAWRRREGRTTRGRRLGAFGAEALAARRPSLWLTEQSAEGRRRAPHPVRLGLVATPAGRPRAAVSP